MSTSRGLRRARALRLVAVALGVIGAGLSASPSAWSQSLQRVTASQAIALALAHNPDNRSAAQDVESARGTARQAHALPNPDVFVSALGNGIRPAQAPIPNQFGVSWSIPLGGKRGAGIAAAESGVSAARSNLVAARRQLALDVETAFVGVLLDQSMSEFARQDQATFRESLDINEVRYKDGKIAYGELLKLRIQARQVDDAARAAAQTLADDRSELARLVGNGVLAPDYQLVGDLTPPNMSKEPTVDSLVRRALDNRGDYQALIAGRASAQSSLTQARRQAIPDLGVMAAYNRVPGTAGTYDLGLSVTVPLFDQNQGNVEQAQASYLKSGLAIDALRAQIRADAERAVRQWRISRERLRSYDRELVQSARESLEISRHSYEEGRGTLLDFLDAESSYRDVERAYRSALADAILAAAAIHFVAGEELR